MSERIYLSPPHMSGEEQKYIKKAFDTNWISSLGENVDEFELTVKSHLDGGFPLAMSSGTAAIHIALILSGVEAGDTVLCSTFTFAASANPICYLGAKPVFVDSSKSDWNVCPTALRKAIESEIERGKRPKALVAVDLLGLPASYDEISSICDEFEIALIEDSAESLGASYKDKKCGLFGRFGIFSFNGNKILSTSGGGILVCQSQSDYDEAKYLITQARDQAPYYLHTKIGFNYRMSNILAGLGIAQMNVLEQRITSRKENYEFYKNTLSDIDDIKFIPELDDRKSNYWLSSLYFDRESGFEPQAIIEKLAEQNIEARRLWNPMHKQPVFSSNRYYTADENSDVSAYIFDRGLSLPSGSQLTKEQREKIVQVFRSALS